MRRTETLIAAAVTLLVAAGCSDNPVFSDAEAAQFAVEGVASVKMSQQTATVEAGQTVQLSAHAFDAQTMPMNSVQLTWESSRLDVATVDANGLVRGLMVGQTYVRARSGALVDSALVTVEPSTAPIARIEMQPAQATIRSGESYRIAALVVDARGLMRTEFPVTWQSSNADVVRVSASGDITGVAGGTASVTATVEGVTGTSAITVQPAVTGPPVAYVGIWPKSIFIAAGQTQQLSAIVRDQNWNMLTNRQVTWASSNSAVAEVSSSGILTARGGGSATITATVEGQTGSASVSVSGAAAPSAPVPVASVSVSPGSGTVMVGQTLQLAAATRDAQGNVLANRTVTWTSSNPAVAAVTASGMVTGVMGGSATITATSEGQSGSAAIAVSVPPQPVATVSVSPSSGSVAVGQTLQLSATTRDATGNVLTGRTVTWSSSNAAVATVSATGLVRGVAAGSVTITATSEGRSSTAGITVTAPVQPVASVAVTPSSATVVAGQTVQLAATPRDANGNVLSGRPVTWASSNSSVATVSSSGLVTGVAGGSVTVSATSEGQTGSASITVTVPAPTVASVTVAPATASLSVGQTVQLSATARDANGNVLSGISFTWTSSNAAVVSVSGTGNATALAAGTATVTASASGRSGSSALTVQAPPTGGSSRVLFFSDWRNQLGNAESAISDGGKWNWMSADASSNGSIIDAPAGFPTHKVFRVQSTGTRSGWIAPTVTTLGEIPIGATRNFRWYHSFHEPALSDAGQHPIQDGGAISQSNWYMSTTNGGSNLNAGQWGLDYFFNGTDWQRSRYVLGTREGQFTPLQKGTIYRFEIQMVRTSVTQFRFHAWVYDAAGNLLYDDDDFRSRDGSTTLGNQVFTFQNVANTSIFLIGLNGIGGTPPWPIHSSDQAGIAVVQGLPERQPIGAYGSVQGEIRR